MKRSMRQCLWLAKTNLMISAFTFGGGYVVVPMVRKCYVEEKGLFREEELLDMAAIAQSTPGAIAMNMVALAGYRVAGVWGAAISCLCALIPPIVILSIVSIFYAAFVSNAVVAAALKGMQAGVAALIVSFVVDMGNALAKEHSPMLYLLVALSFAVSLLSDINVALVLLGSSALCALHAVLAGKAER